MQEQNQLAESEDLSKLRTFSWSFLDLRQTTLPLFMQQGLPGLQNQHASSVFFLRLVCEYGCVVSLAVAG